jgi:hypothetical protein
LREQTSVPIAGGRPTVLDIEDTEFYEHGAVSLKGMARAALRNLTAAKVKEGGSTITQQMIKNVLLSKEKTLTRKLREFVLNRSARTGLRQPCSIPTSSARSSSTTGTYWVLSSRSRLSRT